MSLPPKKGKAWAVSDDFFEKHKTELMTLAKKLSTTAYYNWRLHITPQGKRLGRRVLTLPYYGICTMVCPEDLHLCLDKEWRQWKNIEE